MKNYLQVSWYFWSRPLRPWQRCFETCWDLSSVSSNQKNPRRGQPRLGLLRPLSRISTVWPMRLESAPELESVWNILILFWCLFYAKINVQIKDRILNGIVSGLTYCSWIYLKDCFSCVLNTLNGNWIYLMRQNGILYWIYIESIENV